MIHSLKYDGNTHAARLAAALLTDYLREEVAEHTRFSTHPILLIPLPLHPARERERGFNQMARVLSELPQEFHDGTLARIELNALERVHYRIPQTKLPRAARIKNVRGAFVCSNPKSITNTHIFLIDDVATTGATLASAAEALEAHGAHVSPIALARA